MWSLSNSPNPQGLLYFLNTTAAAVVPLHTGQLKKIATAVGDRVHHLLLGMLPQKYEMRIHGTSVAALVRGETVTVTGTISSWKPGFGRAPASASLQLQDGRCTLSFFGKIGNRYIKQFSSGTRVIVSGTVSERTMFLSMTNPDIFLFDEVWEELLSGYVPVYRKIPGVSHLFLLRVIRELLLKLPQFTEDWMSEREKTSLALPSLASSIHNVHFPSLSTSIELLNDGITPWHKRLAYDTLFFLSFGALLQKQETAVEKSRTIVVPSRLSEEVERSLPFALTDAQKRVLSEIRRDIAQNIPMSRLLQGDVGSGKTVVMLLVGLDVIAAGFKTIIMAPTEILARQHMETMAKLLPDSVTGVLISGSLGSGKKAKKALDQVHSSDFIIGTHALYERLDKMDNVGLVIIDEQHRFGVKQRMQLIQKGGVPDILVVSATPIPRSLALTLFGGIEISVIDEMPPGRKPVKTRFVPHEKREAVVGYVADIIEKYNRKGYWVCPLVEESEKVDAQYAEGVYLELQERFGGKVALLHGRMKAADKERILDSLRDGSVNVLVSTVVIEVGVDVPDASFMVIENAERFGLAQLHQLRGRVGRGSLASFCALIAGPTVSEKAEERLQFLADHHNGFKIAEFDLATRGPGALTGLVQSGFKNDPYFTVAARFGRLVERSREHARSLFEGERSTELTRWFSLLHKERFSRYRSG